jgi:glycosyltransferase involved in cell wall biosynthesis
LKIALLGTRGVPASYSGFETCVEQLGARLVARGHDVTVYCRSHHIDYPEPFYKGMRLIKLPTIPNKYLDTLVHSFVSSLHAATQGYDVALYFIAGNSPVTWIPRMVGQKTILNVDGLDWKREKWPPLAKKYIQYAEYLSTKLPNIALTDSRVVQRYYKERYDYDAPYIAYGSDIEPRPAGEVLQRFGLTERNYILFVGRLVPENCAHHLIQAFRGLETDMKCVIVGDAPYAEAYQAELRQYAADDSRVVLTGYCFGEGYRELGSNAYCFVETSGVGGTHPALLEAMAMGNCVIANNTAENQETIGAAGLVYDGKVGASSLRSVLVKLVRQPDLVEAYRQLASRRARMVYSWDAITDEYEALCERIVRSQAVPKKLEH